MVKHDEEQHGRSEQSTMEYFTKHIMRPRETSSMISETLDDNMQKLFDQLDQDGNGKIDIMELRDLLRSDHRYVTRT